MTAAHSNILSVDYIQQSEIPLYFQVYCGRIWYTDRLLNRFGLLDNILKVRRSEFKTGRSKNYAWQMLLVNGESIRVYDALTIPPQTIVDAGLPNVNIVAKLFSKTIQNKYKFEGRPEDLTIERLKIECENAVNNAQKYLTRFYHIDEHTPNITGYARKYGLLKLIISYVTDDNHGIITRLFTVLQGPAFAGLNFPDNIKTFYAYIERAKHSDDLVRFVLGKAGLPSNRLKKTKELVDLICYLKSHCNAITTKLIRIWTNTLLIAFPQFNGSKLVSDDLVQEVINENENRIFAMREGEDMVRKTLIPYFDVIQAENPFDVFLWDEWHIEFASKSSNKRVRKVLVLMIDGCSKKRIHHMVVNGVNKKVVKQFLYESIRKCNDRVPAEYICDFATYNVADDIKHAMNYLTKKNEKKFFWTLTSNPDAKAPVERIFGTMGTVYLSPVVGSLGAGLLAQRDNAHPAHVIEVFLNNPAYLEDEAYLDDLMESILDRYDRNGVHVKLQSPNEKFKSMKAVNSIQLEEKDIAYMFSNCEERIVRRAKVRLKLGDLTRFFTCYTRDASFSNGKYLDCYYSDDDYKQVYCFEQGTMDYVGCFKQYHSFHGAKINQDEEDKILSMHMFDLRKNHLEDVMGEKDRTKQSIEYVTGGADVSVIIQGLTQIPLPPRQDSLSDIIPNLPDRSAKPIDPFNVPNYKEMKRAGRKAKEKQNETEASRPHIMTDTLRSKIR